MLNVVTFRWKPFEGYRSTFPPASVQTLANMVRRHYHGPHHFICYTDAPQELAGLEGVEARQLWPDCADLENPSGNYRNPSCYRRLKLFSPEMREEIGRRILWLDLDCVITGDVTALWDREVDFMAWGETRRDNHYNGSMGLLRAGAMPQVWQDFDPATSPAATKAAGYFGSDQGWLSYKLGPGHPTWTQRDGVYSYRNDMNEGTGALPRDARIVLFHGHTDPWDEAAQRLAWVRRHYQ